MKKILICLFLSSNLFAFEDLMLTCEGVGRNTKSSSINLNGSDSSSASGTVTTKENFDANITVLFSEKGSWIQIPLSLTSGLNKMSNAFKKDKKNKWDMYDIDISDEELKGRFKLNVLNKPQVVVNRYSGIITMSGLGNGFNGKCSKLDVSKKQF